MSPVPEPTTLLLLCTGVAGIAGLRRRQNALA
ncbi:MAG: PEP-CTERM sorting domain-containing protein [Aeromonadaceae bacterium]|nr:PEP-CTERM sorting domain-containing protein [Aeromonadaceae bacterium]